MTASVLLVLFLVAAVLAGIWLYAVDRHALWSALGTVALFSAAFAYVAVISHT